MTDRTILAVAMDNVHFLKDSDGEVYDLSLDVVDGYDNLEACLDRISNRIKEKSRDRSAIILVDILTPYNHIIPINPRWWYKFVIGLEKSVRLIKDRGIIYPFCGSCNHRVPFSFIRPDNWICPYCSTHHETTDNALNNMIKDHIFHQETQPKLQSPKKKNKKQTTSELPYLYSKVASSSKTTIGPYRIETDRRSVLFLKSMNTTMRFIRTKIAKSLNGPPYNLDYRGWVDEWNDNHGIFAGYKHNKKISIANLSVSDTIISLIYHINDTQKLPLENDPIWIVYWRNIVVDRQTKRISLPRFRGRYLQLPDSATIPTGNYYVEVTMDSDDQINLRFVLSGNLPPKYEPITGKHYRGRHRRSTREPRVKFIEDT